jgi:inorganic pyrophosphatase
MPAALNAPIVAGSMCSTALEYFMRLSAVSIGKNPPEDVNVVIEVPIGGEPIKYEMDKEAGALVVDRFLYTSMRYPGNYGFIPHTLSDDGDPCDVIVANTRAIVPGAIMSCRIVGVLLMNDEAGGDEKLLAVPSTKLTRRYDSVRNYTDLPPITLQQIEHFFQHYKDLEPGKWVKVLRWGDAAEAHQILAEAIARARQSPPHPASAAIGDGADLGSTPGPAA